MDCFEVNKRGRPKKEDPRDILLRVRINDVENAYLSLLCDKENKSKSEVVREAIRFYLTYKDFEKW